jgi:hypothetical protein
MAALSLLLVTVWLRSVGKSWTFAGIPMLFMYVTTIAATLVTAYNLFVTIATKEGQALISVLGAWAMIAVAILLVVAALIIAWDAWGLNRIGTAPPGAGTRANHNRATVPVARVAGPLAERAAARQRCPERPAQVAERLDSRRRDVPVGCPKMDSGGVHRLDADPPDAAPPTGAPARRSDGAGRRRWPWLRHPIDHSTGSQSVPSGPGRPVSLRAQAPTPTRGADRRSARMIEVAPARSRAGPRS